MDIQLMDIQLIIDYLLVIGYTNGTMDYIHWTTPTGEWTPECFSKPRPVTSLWPVKDNIPVDMVTWCHAPQVSMSVVAYL